MHHIQIGFQFQGCLEYPDPERGSPGRPIAPFDLHLVIPGLCWAVATEDCSTLQAGPRQVGFGNLTRVDVLIRGADETGGDLEGP